MKSRPDTDGTAAACHSWEMWEPCFAVESQPVVIRRTSNKHLEAAAGGLGLFCLSAQHCGLLRLQRLQLLHLHERAPRKAEGTLLTGVNMPVPVQENYSCTGTHAHCA